MSPHILEIETNRTLQRPERGLTNRSICFIDLDFKIAFANKSFWNLIELPRPAFQFGDIEMVLASMLNDDLRINLKAILSKVSATKTVSARFELANKKLYLVTLDSMIDEGLILTVEH